MRGSGGESKLSLVILCILLGLLPVVAILQYRWIDRVSTSERERLEGRLRIASNDFARDFNGSLTQIHERMWTAINPGGTFVPEYAARDLSSFLQSGRHRELVSHFYWVVGSKISELDGVNSRWLSTPWPAEIAGLHLADLRHGKVDGAIPAIVLPAGPPGPQGYDSWMVAALNLREVQTRAIPALLARYFPTDEGYAVRIVDANDRKRVLYQSDTQASDALFLHPDIRLRILDVRPDGRPARNQPPPRPREEGPEDAEGPPPPGPPPPNRDPRRPEERGEWTLLITHRAGSLEAAVSEARDRNLALSLAVFLILGAALGFLLVTQRRANRLARLQMEFVAGVSHELRTPLSVICSAAENLSHGVVKDENRVQHYGRLIEGEGRRLSSMVEQIMAFAGAQAGRSVKSFEPVEVSSLVDDALRACLLEFQGMDVTVEKQFSENLPAMWGDPMSLRHCLANLLGNAVKYSNGTKWVRVTAESKDGMRITVEDHGVGIDASDLSHVFEPFFRGRQSGQNNVPGAGLGLSLVKLIVDAHQGQVTAWSQPGQGSRFTLILPLAAGRQGRPT